VAAFFLTKTHLLPLTRKHSLSCSHIGCSSFGVLHSMMPRRDRRSGVRFIEDGRYRSLTFFKRRSGLFKAASDLSTLTGARVAVVLESEHGKFSSFGTPEASPILDAFLLGSAQLILIPVKQRRLQLPTCRMRCSNWRKTRPWRIRGRRRAWRGPTRRSRRPQRWPSMFMVT